MKKKTVFSLAVIAVFCFSVAGLSVSCNKVKSTGDVVDSMKIDTLKFNQKEANVLVEYAVDYPAAGDEPLVNVVREFVNEVLGDAYTGNLAAGDSLVDFYGKSSVASLKRDAQEYGAPSDAPLTVQSTIKKLYETDKLVTFYSETYNYAGGAHGGMTVSAVTFRKSDGRKFGVDILKDRYNGAFTDAVKNGLKKYFNVRTDADLENCLLDVKAYNIPMPQNPPFFTKDGLTFVYQQYEIASYAAGMPTFSIPYSIAKDFLVHAAADVIPAE